MMSILISAALQAAGGEIGTETVKALIPLLKKYGKKAKEWLEQNTNLTGKEQNITEIPAEIPTEIQEEIQEIAQRYFESQKCPVYMDGVIFFFYDVLDDTTKQTLRDLIQDIWGSDDCSEEECTVYEFTNQYMGAEREEDEDFGFEHNTLYLNFAQQGLTDIFYDEAELRKCADALNKLLGENDNDNEIESFVAFR